jgi:hypothetical protein
MDMIEQKRLSQLSPVGKLFVALFTTLMLGVCLWAVWIYTAERGGIDPDRLPAYLTDETEETVEAEIEAIAADSESVLAPVWDSAHHGEEDPFDSTEIDSMMVRAGYEAEDYEPGPDIEEVEYGEGEGAEDLLKHNLGLAHVHINGQTLLFFALGAVFLFTSVSMKLKKIILWLFAVMIVLHTVGLTGEGYHWIFDDMLAVSGVLMLLLIAYMCLRIYVDLGRKRKTSE